MSQPPKVVIVTGGSRGLGEAIVRDLLSLGFRVATCSRGSSAAVKELSAADKPSAAFFWQACELGNSTQEEEFFRAARAWAGKDGLYGLINNAAIVGEGVLATFPVIDAAKIMEVNLMSAMRMARLALRALLRQSRGGRLINISSIVGLRGYTGLAAYAASKGGLDAMTRALAREVGRRGITVNSIAPGYVETELSAALGPTQRCQIVNRTPLGRLATTADVTPAVRFLLSEEAGFITGQTLVVDGGISC